MSAIASQITSLTIVYSTVYSDADERKPQSSASLAFVRGVGEFPAQVASYAENVSIWWRHHDTYWLLFMHSGAETGKFQERYVDKMADVA